MHQQPRMPRGSSSPASSPQTNPLRTNNTREGALGARPQSRSAAMGPPSLDQSASAQPPIESIKKLDQIIQNYHAKVAALVLDSRIQMNPSRQANGNPRVNKWFQLETSEFEDFKDEMKIWKNCGCFDHRPPPMIIEVYLDASSLKESQSLVIVDENGKRWDVLDQLLNASDSSNAPARPKNEVILERWRVELETMSDTPADDFGPILPTVYKKAIVFFRSLFVTTKLLPAWRFTSQGVVKKSHPCLTPRCRVEWADSKRRGPDLLRSPIDGRREPVTDYSFGDLELPVGRLSTSVTYRNDCNFRVDDSESLLSSRFMGVDENFFKPSLPPRLESKRIGSLREHRRHHSSGDAHQTYGSLSTFHGENPIGTSPLSALRAVKGPDSEHGSPPATTPSHANTAAVTVPCSLPITVRNPSTRARHDEEFRRRPSISFQPFKAGSLSDSPVPRQPEPESPASAHSLTRPGGLPSLQIRTRSSLTAGMPASLRGVPNPPPMTTDLPVSSSPRPASASRYSSSFSHRRNRPSVSGASKAGDEDTSSGRQSLSNSAAQPGSGFLAEVGAASYGSLQTDEDDISDFLKALDSKKTLRSFEPTQKGESSGSKTVAQLSKFQMMKESNNALTESMTSSAQLQRSSIISSRHLSNLAGTSTSPGGKPASPHTAHTPAIPSRLSENSIIDYTTSHGRRSSSREHNSQQSRGGSRSSGQATTTQDGATAIDIPMSPRLDSYQRRASSVAQQVRAVADDESDHLPFAAEHRSISLGDQDREAPTLSVLLGRQAQGERGDSSDRGGDSGRLRLAAGLEIPESPHTSSKHGSAAGTPPSSLIPPAQTSSSFQRRRYGGMASITGHRPTPPYSARETFNGPGGRAIRPEDEVASEEPLMFTLSEISALGRRSMEEGRQGSQGSSDPPTFEPRGITRRGWAE